MREGFLDGNYKFTQTDFLIMYCLNRKKMILKEIIEKTGLSRNTVNTTLTRLVEKKQVERNKVETNFEYSLKNNRKESFSKKEEIIFDFLIKNYRKILTPNVVWLIVELLENETYNIKDLIGNGWKQAGLYKCNSKLIAANIIEKEKNGEKYFFSEEILNLVPNIPLKIATLNMDYFMNKEDMEKRTDAYKNKLLSKADIWALQDINIPILKKLVGDKYQIKYPGDGSMAALLIKSEIYKEYEPLVLKNDGEFSLRYTYGILKLLDGRRIRILNLYVPQSFNVSEDRKSAIKTLWDSIINEVRKCRIEKEEFILLGDLNAYTEIYIKDCKYKKEEISENGENLKRLQDLLIDTFEDWESLGKDDTWGYTWNPQNNNKWRRLDYIFINHYIKYNDSITTGVIDNDISDHKGLWINIE